MMNFLIFRQLPWIMTSTGPGGTIVKQGAIASEQAVKEIRYLQKNLHGKTITYYVQLIAREAIKRANVATMSFQPSRWRAEVSALMKLTHLNINPPVYSQKLAGGGPFKQRLDAMMAGLARIFKSQKPKPPTREEAKQVFFALDRVRFAPAGGPISQAVSDTVGIQMAAASRSLFK
jgi:hypothetical protein